MIYLHTAAESDANAFILRFNIGIQNLLFYIITNPKEIIKWFLKKS